jgi:hypothetical protein
VLGTYAATLLACGSALVVGQAVLSVCGWRRWSWLAPVVGLGTVVAIAWGAVQLPGEGATVLGAVLAFSAAALIVLVGRTEGAGEAAREGLPAAAVALVAASIPFIVEGRFGVLGTGFNVDMSQHLFAADWLADPSGPAPGLVEQGYPLGPHGLAVAAAELGNLVHGFSGVTIAVPVLAALCSLVVLRELPPHRRTIAAALVALPYMVASYLAQGQFKELLEGFFLLGFALCLHQLAAGWAAGGPPRMCYLAAVPLAAIALGSLYSYSAPGLAWLAAAGVLFAAAEVVRRRRTVAPGEILRRAALPVAIGLLVLVAGAAPELGRVVNFQGNAAKVARSGEDGNRQADRAREPGGGGGTGGGGEARERHNDDLGNLFNEIPPLEALGVWPSGDFRVDPGDGAAPAIAFYLGSLLGALALLLALARWLRRGETAVPAALVGAIAIYAAAWAFSTPYAAAKAIMMIAPLAMLITVRELLDPAVLTPAVRSRGAVAVAAVAGAFVVAAAASSVLALGNAPVGPDSYSPGLARMRSAFEGQPTLVLADPQALADEHARDFLAWEARGGDPVCIEPAPRTSAGTPPPDGIRFVVTTTGETEPPFADLSRRREELPYTLWERRGRVGGRAPDGPQGNPSECGLTLGRLARHETSFGLPSGSPRIA